MSSVGRRPSDRFVNPAISHQFIHLGTLADAADRLFAPESKPMSSVFSNQAIAADVLDDACEQINLVYRRLSGPPPTNKTFINVGRSDCGISLRWSEGKLEASRSQRARVVFVRPDPASNKVAILTAYPQFNKKDPQAEVDLEAAVCASMRFRSAPYAEALPIRLAAHLGQEVHILMEGGRPVAHIPVEDPFRPGLHLRLEITENRPVPVGFALKSSGADPLMPFEEIPGYLETSMGLDPRRSLAAYCQTHQEFPKKLMRAPELVENPKAITDAELARRAMAFQRETKAAAEEIRQRREGALRATSRIRGPQDLGR